MHKIKFVYTGSDLSRTNFDQSLGDIGFDIKAEGDCLIKPHDRAIVSTGLKIADCPTKLCGSADLAIFFKIEGRSGLASKGVFPVGGIVDPTYRGEIKVILINHSSESYFIKSGDKIAQIVIYAAITSWSSKLKFSNLEFIQVNESEIVATERDDKGFGSSGQ